MRAPVALSCGEPAGIGPEIAAAAWRALRADLPLLWIGDPSHLPDGTPWAEATPASAAQISADALPVLARNFGGPRVPGIAQPGHAKHVIQAISDGAKLAHSGACAALCTAPIHKQALMDGGGFAFPGHTEFLADLAGVARVVMMLACDQLRVVPATIHIALRQVPQVLTAQGLEDVIRITHRAMAQQFGIPDARIAVAGLNPHAGEGGKMGTEDDSIIVPVITKLAQEGMQIWGPLPADTMFHSRARTQYDVAIGMYHDQALIPIKTLDFDGGVNVTLGLPFIRTSPDHGTAFDIAGRGIARADSLIAALKMADDMARRQRSGN